MRKNSNNVSGKNRTIGMLAIAAFLVLFASTLGMGWISLSAVAGTSDIDDLGDPVPEPAGGWGSGWINDTVTEVLGVDCRDPAMATGPGGVLHAVFQCNVAVGGWGIFYTTSTDGGETWSPQRGAANTADDESDPDIAVSPDNGRIFVVYERLVAPGNRDIWSTWSDDGVTWNQVLITSYPGEDVNPSVTVEHNHGLPYYVYITLEAHVDTNNRNVLVYRSTDRGLTWGQELNHGSGDQNVYADPDICYQAGTDGNDYLYVVFVEGVDAADMYEISIIWSDDYAVTWSAPYTIQTETDFVLDPSIAGSRDGDKLMFAYSDDNGGDRSIKYGYNHDPTAPAGGWTVLTRGTTATNGISDRSPEVKADGEGTTDVTISGTFHMVWTQAGPDWHVVYATSLTTGGGFGGMAVVTDLQASATYPWKGLTTQLRGGTWYPCLNYAELTGMYDIYYTTPGMRSFVDTNPTGLNINVDGAPLVAPVLFNWPAGLPHDLWAPSPQAMGPTSQWAWVSWSDAGAQGHTITAGTIDTNYTANYVTQYQIIIDTLPVNLDIDVDTVTTFTPAIFWWDVGSVHDLDAISPQGTLPGIRYVYNSWSDGLAQAHQITVIGADTITATYDRQYFVEVIAFDNTNGVDLNGVEVTVNAAPVGFTPWTGAFAGGDWFQEGVNIDIGTENPYFDGINNFLFVDWSTGSANNPLPYTPINPITLTAYYVEAPASYFSVSVNPPSVTVAPGDIATYTVTVQSHNGYTGNVDLSTVANPGVENFAPPTVSPPADGSITSTLTIDTTAVVDGTYPFTIVGGDGMFTNNTGAELIVATPTFDVTATPGFQTIANAAGQTAVIDVTVSSVSGYSGPVDLDISLTNPGGFIPPATYQFVPAQVTVPVGGSDTSVLTITNAAGVPDNTYTVWIQGDDGVDTHDFGVDVDVTTMAFFTVDASPPLRSISPGQSTSYTVTVTSMNNYAGNVDVSVGHAISTADATLTWDKTALVIPDGGSDTATLTVVTTGSIALQDYTLDFWADDGLGLNFTDQSTLNLTALVSGSISGVVTDQDGNPIDDATVELLDDQDNLVDDTVTNNDGEYDFSGVGAGDYTVRATMDGYEEDTATVTVSAGDPDQTDKDLELELITYEIEGIVEDSDTGDPIAGATVEVYDENGDLVDTDTTSGSGRFSIDDLPPGTYTVVITADGYKTYEEDVVIIDQNEDLGDVGVSPKAEGDFLADYWWLLLLIIIIVVVIIIVALLAKRKKPAPEEAPPEYATAQVPAEQAPPYQEAPAEQPPYQEAPPEQYPQEPQPETPPEEPQPETPPEETPPETPPEGYPPEE